MITFSEFSETVNSLRKDIFAQAKAFESLGEHLDDSSSHKSHDIKLPQTPECQKSSSLSSKSNPTASLLSKNSKHLIKSRCNENWVPKMKKIIMRNILNTGHCDRIKLNGTKYAVCQEGVVLKPVSLWNASDRPDQVWNGKPYHRTACGDLKTNALKLYVIIFCSCCSGLLTNYRQRQPCMTYNKTGT